VPIHGVLSMFSDFVYFFQIWHQNTFDFHPWVVVLTSGTRTTRLKLPLQFVCCSGNVEGGGSVPGHRVYNCDRAGADKQLMADYFVERPLYNEDHFRRRYFVMFTSCPTIY